MKLVIGSDHGGYNLKEKVKKILSAAQHEVEDVGTFNEDSCDYPDYAEKVAQTVASGRADRGILICGTGIGMSISANKVKGIRAALCTDTYMARMSRAHNDANILVLGGRVLGPGLAEDIVNIWLTTAFEGGRHAQRVKKMSALEK